MLQISLTAPYLLHLTASIFKEGIGQESNGAANQEKQIFLLGQISPSASSTIDLGTGLARALKENIFFYVDFVVKKQERKNRNMVYRGLYSYRQQVRVITRFPNIFFRIFFLYVERFCKSFWKEGLTRTSSSFA